jgi:hypothetical protein
MMATALDSLVEDLNLEQLESTLLNALEQVNDLRDAYKTGPFPRTASGPEDWLMDAFTRNALHDLKLMIRSVIEVRQKALGIESDEEQALLRSCEERE